MTAGRLAPGVVFSSFAVTGAERFGARVQLIGRGARATIWTGGVRLTPGTAVKVDPQGGPNWDFLELTEGGFA